MRNMLGHYLLDGIHHRLLRFESHEPVSHIVFCIIPKVSIKGSVFEQRYHPELLNCSYKWDMGIVFYANHWCVCVCVQLHVGWYTCTVGDLISFMLRAYDECEMVAPGYDLF